MYQNSYLDATQQSQYHSNTSNGSAANIPNDRKEHTKVPSATLHCFEGGTRSLRSANENFVNYHNLPPDYFHTPTAPNAAAWQDSEDDAYHIPSYSDLSKPQEEADEAVKLAFDPPLTHYAELRGGLPIGYVWLPPGSPEPMPRETTPEQEAAAFVTPKRPVSTMASSKNRLKKKVKFATPQAEKNKRHKRETTAEYQQRFTSPLSEELSDAPDGLLTPETRRRLF